MSNETINTFLISAIVQNGNFWLSNQSTFFFWFLGSTISFYLARSMWKIAVKYFDYLGCNKRIENSQHKQGIFKTFKASKSWLTREKKKKKKKTVAKGIT